MPMVSEIGLSLCGEPVLDLHSTSDMKKSGAIPGITLHWNFRAISGVPGRTLASQFHYGWARVPSHLRR